MKKMMLAAGLLALVSQPVLAEGINVEPGQWEMTTTLNMPMMPAPQTTTVSQCIEDSVFDMGDMSTEGMDPNCNMSAEQVDDSTMQWTMDCPVEGGGTSHAKWRITSAGKTIEGDGKISVSVMGQEMEMTSTFSGKHTGPCT